MGHVSFREGKSIFYTPGKLTWNLKMPPKGKGKRFIYKPPVLGFHVNFRGCIFQQNSKGSSAWFKIRGSCPWILVTILFSPEPENSHVGFRIFCLPEIKVTCLKGSLTFHQYRTLQHTPQELRRLKGLVSLNKALLSHQPSTNPVLIFTIVKLERRDVTLPTVQAGRCQKQLHLMMTGCQMNWWFKNQYIIYIYI